MKLTIEVEMNNAAFADNPGEIAGILRKLADRTLDASEELPWDGRLIIKDSNGNKVGFATVEEDGE